MGRRGNPYDNAMMESFMKTLQVEGVYPPAFETSEDVAEHLPHFTGKYNAKCLHSRRDCAGWRSPRARSRWDHRRPESTRGEAR